MTDNRNTANYNDGQPYVVGILSPSTTLYIDQMPPSNRETSPPTDLNLRRRNTNSFQITSVTVQGSRKNDDFADDSADDLDESHTDDLSSDFLDSSRADNEGYHSEDSNPIVDDLSPCGPIIFTQLPSRDPNMNLSIGVTPTFTAIGPSVVAGGVTMMTSKSESPISAQVPIMNPLPDNWQRRFKVVKIVSSEPFRRGRWLCMDFKDPPTNVHSDSKLDSNGTSTPPSIQITSYDADNFSNELLNSGDFAQVYEIPINQTFNGNFVMGNHQQMYGIILPQSEHLQPVTLVQDLSLQTTTPIDKNFNNLVNRPTIRVETAGQIGVFQDPAFQSASLRRVQTIINKDVSTQSPPSSLSANNNYNNNITHAVPNHVISSTGRNSPDVIMRTNLEDTRVVGGFINVVQPAMVEKVEMENSESYSSLANELSRLPRRNPPTDFGSNGLCCSPPLQARVLPPAKPVVIPPQPVPAANTVVAPVVVAPPTAVTLPNANAPLPTTQTLAESNSSQTAPEKIPASEVGHEVDPSAGSAASTGGNTVAIDNKIEQAMDLVKSHLMFAVREEVEVLKEKITELLERISQLEHENDILRANASAETLKQLSNQSQKKSTGGGTTGKPQSVAAVPPST